MSLNLPIEAIRAAARKIGLQSEEAAVAAPVCADADVLCQLHDAVKDSGYDIPGIDVVPAHSPSWMQDGLTWLSNNLSNRYFDVTPVRAALGISAATTVVGTVATVKLINALRSDIMDQCPENVFNAVKNNAERLAYVKRALKAKKMDYLIALEQLSADQLEVHFANIVDNKAKFGDVLMADTILQMDKGQSIALVSAIMKKNSVAFNQETHDARLAAHGKKKAKAVEAAPVVDTVAAAPSKGYLATAYSYMPSMSLARFRKAAPAATTEVEVKAEDNKEVETPKNK